MMQHKLDFRLICFPLLSIKAPSSYSPGVDQFKANNQTRLISIKASLIHIECSRRCVNYVAFLFIRLQHNGRLLGWHSSNQTARSEGESNRNEYINKNSNSPRPAHSSLSPTMGAKTDCVDENFPAICFHYHRLFLSLCGNLELIDS